MNIVLKEKKYLLLTDLLILLFLYYVPAMSHLMGFPLYKLEPMRIAILGSLFFTGNKHNALLLALTIPLFSVMVSGHPVSVKAGIIALEMMINVLVFDRLIRSDLFKSSNYSIGLKMMFSIIISKVAYYIMKYIAVSIGLLSTSIVDTGLLWQLGTTILISVLFINFNSCRK